MAAKHNERYQVVPYSTENLVALFCCGSPESRKSFVENKPQIQYLEVYCSELKVKTLIFEEVYVDAHYSEDYWGYYAKCFSDYPSKCSRIHLLSKDINSDQFNFYLTNIEKDKRLEYSNEFSYQGFIVVKPLPETVVGRVCVQAIPDTKSSGIFPTISEQTANLFGVPLLIQSLPFQEQDHEVGACATSALWSVICGTSKLFNHPSLSPIEITNRALNSFPVLGRSLPNDGLNMHQMGGVAQSLGLEVDLIDAREQYRLQSCAYAYLKCGIPLLFGIDFNLDPPNNQSRELHAVTLVGFALDDPNPNPIPQKNPHPNLGDTSGFKLVASKLNCFYVHDDGVGPFAPLELDKKNDCVITRWKDPDGELERAKPDQILIPLYSQIRTHFIDVLEGTAAFDQLLQIIHQELDDDIEFGQFEWDIYLVDVRKFKSEIHTDHSISKEKKLDLLTKNLPHFMWRISACGENDEKILEFLLDATDLRQGRQLIHLVDYNSKYLKILSNEFRRLKYEKFAIYSIDEQMIRHISEMYS